MNIIIDIRAQQSYSNRPHDIQYIFAIAHLKLAQLYESQETLEKSDEKLEESQQKLKEAEDHSKLALQYSLTKRKAKQTLAVVLLRQGERAKQVFNEHSTFDDFYREKPGLLDLGCIGQTLPDYVTYFHESATHDESPYRDIVVRFFQELSEALVYLKQSRPLDIYVSKQTCEKFTTLCLVHNNGRFQEELKKYVDHPLGTNTIIVNY